MIGRELAVVIAQEAPEIRGDLAYAIGCALDLRGLEPDVDPARYERLEQLGNALSDAQAIEASLDQLLIRRAARSAGAGDGPSAAAVRRSLNEPTMWGESEVA